MLSETKSELQIRRTCGLRIVTCFALEFLTGCKAQKKAHLEACASCSQGKGLPSAPRPRPFNSCAQACVPTYSSAAFTLLKPRRALG